MSVLRAWALVAAVTTASVVFGSAADAGAPTDQLRGRIDRVLTVLDGELKQDGRSEERRAALRKIAHETFDFREISQRTLARHWQARTAAEREEFVPLFADLLERTYVGQIEQYSGGEKIVYLGDTVDGNQALVRTRLVTKAGTEVPVDYRMHRVGEQWLVYDVAIEGVSLVSNYRAQFDRIIRSSSYKGLTDKLRARRDETPDSGAVKRAATQK